MVQMDLMTAPKEMTKKEAQSILDSMGKKNALIALMGER